MSNGNWTPAPKITLEQFVASLKGQEYLILDTETTGLNDGEIVQIAVIDQNGNTYIDTLVHPKMPIPAEATAIHGITNEHVKFAPEWPTVREYVIDAVKGQNLIVYNAVYDRKMMHKSDERWDIWGYDWRSLARWYCAMEAYAEHFGEWNQYHGNFKWQKLVTAVNQLGFPVADAHNALADCHMTRLVVQSLLTLEGLTKG